MLLPAGQVTWGGSPMTPLLTALIGATVVVAGSLVAREATRYAANLQGAQRCREAEIAHLAEFRDAMVDALTSFGTYKHVLGRMSEEKLLTVAHEQAVTVLEDAGDHGVYRVALVQKLERLRTLAHGLMWPELREGFTPVETMVLHTDDFMAVALQVHAHPEVIEAFVVAVTNRHRTLLETYPGRQMF
jgi:hypothetical protein